MRARTESAMLPGGSARRTVGGDRLASGRGAKRQRGQVLVWFLAFTATLALIFAGVYSVGQVTSEKQKVVNATDAAAYSGALVEARALNLTAYTNRAVIANEVLIAQMVSLQSWTDYFAEATLNYERILNAMSGFPYIGVFFKALAAIMQGLNELTQGQQNALKEVIPSTIIIWEGAFEGWYNGAIAPAFLPSVMAFAAKSAADSVLQKNVAVQGGRVDVAPHLIATENLMALNEIQWQRVTKRYSGDNRKYAKQLLLTSCDTFSTKRPGSDYFLLDLLFGGADGCIPFAYHVSSEKNGVTQLADYQRWEAQDTLALKQQIFPKGCSWGKSDFAIPVGWGRSVADKEGRTKGNFINGDGGTGGFAYQNTKMNGNWSGVKELFDVDRNGSDQPSHEDFTYAIAAAKSNTDVRTNDTLNFMKTSSNRVTGSMDLQSRFEVDQIMAVAEARIFFARPVRNTKDITGGGLFRADKYQEYASLYNPYWQVRLVSPSAETRAAVYPVNDIDLAPFAQ